MGRHWPKASESSKWIRRGKMLVFAVIMFVVLMPFFALAEVGRDIGDDKLFEQFFVRRSPYVSLKS